MKIFQRVQIDLASLGHRPNQSPFNKTQLWVLVKMVMYFFSLIACNVLEQHTSKQYMDSILMIAALILLTTARVSILFQNATIFDFIDRVEKSLETRLKYPGSMELYERTNQRVEAASKLIYSINTYIAVPGFVLPNAIFCYFRYFVIEDLGSEAFDLSLPLWFPFDWKNPIGYLIVVIIQLVFTSTIMGLAILFSDIYQISLVVLFLGCTGAMCLALLMIQLDISSNEIDSVVVLQSLACGFWALCLVFVVCEIGQRFTNTFAELNVTACQLEWYLYPVKVQQVFVLLYMYAQKPGEITFFGSYVCSREQFKKVVNKTYSFFMVLRKVFG